MPTENFDKAFVDQLTTWVKENPDLNFALIRKYVNKGWEIVVGGETDTDLRNYVEFRMGSNIFGEDPRWEIVKISRKEETETDEIT